MEREIVGYYKALFNNINKYRREKGKDPLAKEKEEKIARAVDLVIMQSVVKRIDIAQFISGKVESIPWTKEHAQDTVNRCAVIAACVSYDGDFKDEDVVEKLKKEGVSDPEEVFEDVKRCLRELELRAS